MSANRFRLRKLAFTGPGRDPRSLEFGPKVNVIWGASNSGKTFAVRALDHMFGAKDELPPIPELEGFETCWLELDLPLSGRTTLARSVRGGGFKLFGGSVDTLAPPLSNQASGLAASHKAKGDSLSSFLLNELGVADHVIARTQQGDKGTLTFRHFVTYVLTKENPMMGEASPIRISEKSGDTFDRNVFRFMLTGIDDRNVVAVPSVDRQRSANVGKIEIVDEMITAALQELIRLFPDDPDPELIDLVERDTTLAAAERLASMAEAQTKLDALRGERRSAIDELDTVLAGIGETVATLDRFKLLASVYDSDVERLEGLDEGADALVAGSRRACPTCGAPPEHQTHAHGLERIEATRAAVRAEIAKIERERTQLKQTMGLLWTERNALEGRARDLTASIDELGRRIDGLAPIEIASRRTYEEFDAARHRIREGLSIRGRLEGLRERRRTLDTFRPTRPGRDTVRVGIDGVLGHQFAQRVQAILRAWRFPGDPVVSFNEDTHDIRLDGRDRNGNGKGVRALMHSAFKIAVRTHCRDKELPHPGIVVLDSPLLSYRDPHKSRHGALTSDEEAVSRSGLKERFYEYLADEAADTQFVVVENDAPEVDLGPEARLSTFTGPTATDGRRGLL